jgi:hypothetical protein
MVSLLAERRRHAAEVTRRKTVESKTYTVEEAAAFYTAEAQLRNFSIVSSIQRQRA